MRDIVRPRKAPSPTWPLWWCLEKLMLVIEQGFQLLYALILGLNKCPRCMAFSRQGQKVSWSIISSNSIQVMDYVTIRNWPFMEFFPDKDMFSDITICSFRMLRIAYHYIPRVLINKSTTFPPRTICPTEHFTISHCSVFPPQFTRAGKTAFRTMRNGFSTINTGMFMCFIPMLRHSPLPLICPLVCISFFFIFVWHSYPYIVIVSDLLTGVKI